MKIAIVYNKKSIDEHDVINVFGIVTKEHYSYKTVENYAQRVLDVNKEHIKRTKMTDDEIFSKLFHNLNESLNHDLKINHDEYVVTEFREIFVPIYETKCYDKKNKVVIARIDAVSGKII